MSDTGDLNLDWMPVRSTGGMNAKGGGDFVSAAYAPWLGGWLVRNVITLTGQSPAVALIFVRDEPTTDKPSSTRRKTTHDVQQRTAGGDAQGSWNERGGP